MEDPQPAVPQLELIGRCEATIAPALEIGDAPAGRRRLIPITGGTFEGPRLRGEVLPGADWITVRSDGTSIIDTRYALRTGDGALIAVRTNGLAERGYFRFAVRFETAAPAYDWLNHGIFVASARVSGTTVRYDCYRVT